jgi:tetratricopeptide (TPR) repeat protein
MNINSLSRWFFLSLENTSTRRVKLCFFSVIFLTFLISPELFASSNPDSEPVSNVGESSSLLVILLFVSGVLGLGAFIIFALTSWGRKQDDIDNMMSFCIKYFYDTEDEAEKCKAASALGKTKNTGALLVLIDVINDEKTEPTVRAAAEKALGEMGQKNRRYTIIIAELISAIRNNDHQKVIDILISNFEQSGKKYSQSAYVIGREFIRLNQYDVGRKWFRKAKIRNKKFNLYGSQIELDIRKCNEYLFAKGDSRFKEGDYYSARELYTLASTRIGEKEKMYFSAYLRLACVYCKIGDYVDADQSTLQALQHHHRTDLALILNKLIVKMLNKKKQTPNREAEIDNVKKEIDRCIAVIMTELHDS